MQISTSDWKRYIDKLRQMSDIAAEKMQKWVQLNGFGDTKALIDYAYALVTKYGEGSAELACEMYDAIAELSGVTVPSAIPANTATYGETAKAINGSLIQSESGQLLNQVVSRLVKQAGADTTLQNAERDGAQFAWIPSGDTCAFCIALASRGWQYRSAQSMRNGHAEHIHANCDCQYAIRFNSKTDYAGYNLEEYAEEYYSNKGNSRAKINAMRRKAYDPEKRKAQREALAERKDEMSETD